MWVFAFATAATCCAQTALRIPEAVTYGESSLFSPLGWQSALRPSVSKRGKSSSLKEGEGAHQDRRLRIELNLSRSWGQFLLDDGLGSSVVEFARDEVEAMELVCVEIGYVDDSEGPVLLPCCCSKFATLPCAATRDLVLRVALLFDG